MLPVTADGSAPMKQLRTIVLVNPISNEGHLDSWHVLFVKLLTHAGWSVIAMTSDPDGLAQKLRAKGLTLGDTLRIVDTNASSAATNTRLVDRCRKVWLDWNAYCEAAQYQRHWRQGACAGQPRRGLASMGPHLKQAALRGLMHVTAGMHLLYGQLRNRSVRSQAPAPAYFSQTDFRDQVNAVIAQHPQEICAVLNMYIDAYRPDQASWEGFAFRENLPWAALCITPTDSPQQGYYTVPSYQGTLLLDEFLTARYRLALPSKRFEYLPDITETVLPDQASSLSRALVAAAAGRKIVFMGGSIGKQKNLARWFELIALADPQKWFFVQIGRINKNNLTPEDALSLEKVLAAPPANLYVRPEYLADERFFNEIISISSVIFAVYRDFGRSSNMLSKAAYFEKPILVASNCLMGDRVERYRIGKAVSQDDTLGMHEGLLALETIENVKANFQLYRNDFSETIMQQKLSNFLQQCIAN